MRKKKDLKVFFYFFYFFYYLFYLFILDLNFAVEQFSLIKELKEKLIEKLDPIERIFKNIKKK